MCNSQATYVAIADAARILETTEMRVLMMLKKQELQGKLEDEVWYVERASLDQCDRPKASDIVKKGCGSGGCGSGCSGH